jgi:CPA1 family monovalent cation:H+ antiporter
VLVPVVIVAIIVTRAVFVLLMTAVNRVRSGSVGPSMLKGAVILSWAGARGPVSGLAAFAIPVTFAAGDEVPFRDVILATTFCVIVVTLLLSFTLAPLSRLIRLPQDDDEALVRRVDAALARAALERLGDLEAEAAAAGTPLPPDLVRLLQEEANRRIERSIETAPAVEQDADARAVTTGRALIRAEQEELIRLRDEEGLPDAIVRPLLRELDIRAQALNSRH